MRQVSDKQKIIKAAIKQAYDEIAEERAHMCTGCGTYDRLSHSHIISRSRRPDLAADKRNITYHCMDGLNFLESVKGCHTIWEHGTLEEKQALLDYDQMIAYIQEVDPSYYHILTNK